MQFKKAFVAGVVSFAVLSTSPALVSTVNAEDLKPISAVEEITGKGRLDVEKQAQFMSITGKIIEIKDHEGQQGASFILIEDEQGQLANLVISKDTYIIDNAKFMVGSVVTGFYDASKPMIMIYPAQYSTEVIAVADKDQNIKVDRFDENLVSYDNQLQLRISDDTEIIMQDGKAFEGELVNKKLAVTYGISTRSVPAQTTPSKVVVLFEEEENTNSTVEASTKEQAVSDKQGIILTFLRVISGAFGFSGK